MEKKKMNKAEGTGELPEGWAVKRLVYLSDIQQGVSKGKKIDKAASINVPYLRVANVKDGRLDLSEVKLISINKNEIKKYQLHYQDILITEGGDSDKLGRGSLWLNEIEGCIYQNHLFRIRSDEKILIPYYLYYYLQGFSAKTYFLSCAKQTTGIASINSSQVRATPILLPPLPEQRAIAACLSAWDAAIAKTTQLIAQKELRKKWLMQGLLTGKRRVKGFEEAWREVRLKDVFERVTRKNNEGNTNVVTISAQRGFIRQDDFFNKIVASEVLDNYFLVLKGEFCYNKSYSNGYPWGATKRLNDFENAVVTTLYICFGIKNKHENSGDFFEQFLEANLLDKGLTKIAHEGGRAHGLLNVTPNDFFNLHIKIPTFPEQTAIAHILQAADREIRLLKAGVDRLKEQKRGVMQQLLTGKKRLGYEKDI